MDVVVGLGVFEESVQALDRTIERARTADDSVTVAVLDVPTREQPLSTVVRRVREYLGDVDVPIDVRPLEGTPGPALVTFAEEGAFDQVVLANTKRTPMGKIQVSELTEFVLLNSQVTVILVR